jgi:hypothetical protein
VEWLFGEIDGNGVAADSSGNDRDGTLFGDSRPTAAGGALQFNGKQFVAARGPLVDTSRSFTVSARVTLDSLEESQTIVSQDSSDASAFMLQYDSLEEQWEMRIPERDVNDAQAFGDEATSNVKPQAGQRTHLTGVYDDASNELRLYVNGELGQTVEHADDFRSAGSFVAGRGLSNNEFFQGLDGKVDDVRAFPRALSSAEVKSLDGE